MKTVFTKVNHIADLSKKPTKKSYSELLNFLRDTSRNVRLESFEAIAWHYSKFSKVEDLVFLINDSYPKLAIQSSYFLHFHFNLKGEKLFKKCLELLRKTKDEILLIDLLEVLRFYSKKMSIADVNHLSKSRSLLVKTYLYPIFGDLFGSRQLKKILEEEKSSRVKVSICINLYFNGEKEYLNKLIQIMLKTKDRQIILLSVNLMCSYAKPDDIKEILNATDKVIQKNKHMSSLKKQLDFYTARLKPGGHQLSKEENDIDHLVF